MLEQRQGGRDLAELDPGIAGDPPGLGMRTGQLQPFGLAQPVEDGNRLFDDGDAGGEAPPDQLATGRKAERPAKQGIVAEPPGRGECRVEGGDALDGQMGEPGFQPPDLVAETPKVRVVRKQFGQLRLILRLSVPQRDQYP